MPEFNDQDDYNVIMTKKGLDLARRVSIIDVNNTTKDQLAALKTRAKDMIPKRIVKEIW